MSPSSPSLPPWTRRLAWSNSPQAWAERVGLLLVAISAALLWWHAAGLSALQLVFGWGTLLLVLAVLSRRGWVKLFGPVLFYDLVRTGRRSRYYLFRILYALILLGVLWWVYLQFKDNLLTQWLVLSPPPPPGLAPPPGGGWNWTPQRGTLTGREGAQLAEWFFYAFVALQFAAVYLLTPAYTAGALAEEKERKTLEFLLATDLHSREIVLSKLASRLLQLTLLVLTGLPILGFAQFLGGIDPNLVLAGFAVTGLTMASVASFSILCSTYTRKVRDAIILTYLGLAAYLGFSFVVAVIQPPLNALLGNWIYAGNLFAAALQLREDVVTNRNLADTIPGMLKWYALFHGLAAAVCVLLAVTRLRGVALRQLQNKTPTARPTGSLRRTMRPRVGRLPMLWKELFAEPGFQLSWPGLCVVGLLVFVSMVPAVWLLGQSLIESGVPRGIEAFDSSGNYVWFANRGEFLAHRMNRWVRLAGTGVACLLLIAIAVRASGCITGERDKETLDGLLLSPLQSYDILFAKWLGSLLSIRWGMLWLALIWMVGMGCRALHPAALVLVLMAFLVYAVTLAGLGVWFSTVCRTTLRATMSTLAVTALLSTGHWILWLFCLPLGTDYSRIAALLTPPAVLHWLAAPVREFGNSTDWDVWTILSLFGLFLWALLAALLWTVTTSRFRRISMRMPYRRPDSAVVYQRRVLANEPVWR